MKLKIGDQAPFFEGIDQYGSKFDSQEFINVKNLVVYFYPKNETKVCTAQACSFRDSYEDFKDLNCLVVGISGDSEKSHGKFAKNHSLPFILISDGDKKIRKNFAVPRDLLGLLPGRYTFVINKKGIIISVFHDISNAQNHTDDAMKALKKDVNNEH
jgi:peroxiredoxin Q/BCP